VAGSPAKPQLWNRYSYVGNQPIDFHDSTGAYRTDFHRDLTEILAIAAGYSRSEAHNIALMTELPDHDSRDPEEPGNFLARAMYHFPDQSQLNSHYVNAAATGDDYSIGTYLHALQDSFSHSGYGAIIGHIGAALKGYAHDRLTFNSGFDNTLSGTQESYDVDTTSLRPEVAMAAARATYDALTQLNRTGKPQVAFSALQSNILGYLAADEHSVLRQFFYERLRKQVGLSPSPPPTK